jgi:aryl-alcohol dehydrogenase-like predicted oxidoreductase
VEAISKFAAKKNATPAQIALAWLLARTGTAAGRDSSSIGGRI